ncbi:MAG: PIG-L deacetylase family protein [Candidatus Hodarchaeales archaeon]|jgi:LmbE family N-acetylglucosaminyl deacetylase
MKNKYENVLVLAAHPDDETIGAGATIKKLHQLGSKIHLITFTDGVSARDANEQSRSKILENVCMQLGIDSFDSATFPDNKMDTVSTLDVCKFIEQKVLFEPDLIITHDISCLNVDHKKVNEATLTVFRPQSGKNKKIITYYIPSSTDYNFNSHFHANFYVDVESTYGIKMKCLRDNYSQEMRPHPHSRSFENIEMLMRTWGAEVGLRYAEKFKLLMSIGDV